MSLCVIVVGAMVVLAIAAAVGQTISDNRGDP